MPGELQIKWPKSQAAAATLRDRGLHVSVVHCAYYACVQLMKHIVIYNIGISSEDIESEVTQTRQSTHAFLINQITTLLRHEDGDWSLFSKKINDLKRLRNDVDYSDEVPADSAKSETSIQLSDDVINMLRQYQ